MLCQICQKHVATTHIKRTVNGASSELYVCSDCASKQSANMLNGVGINVGNLFGGLFTIPTIVEADAKDSCTCCGKTYREIVQSGILGCPECYISFYERLLPSIQRIHGKTSHVGKIAVSGSSESRSKRELVRLKDELTKALALQEYERCAHLRDQIKALEVKTDE